MVADFDWQKQLFSRWKEQNYIGLVKAVTGAGKTHAGALAIRELLDESPDEDILIVSPSSKINQGWREELEKMGLHDIPIMTYQSAVNAMQRNGLKCTTLVCDEAHRLCAPVQGRVLEMNPMKVLGLSATPEDAVEILGPPFIEVSFEEANICDFMIHYVKFKPTAKEMADYVNATKKMEYRALEVTNGAKKYLPPRRDAVGWQCYDTLARKRREVCYLMPSRLGHALTLIKANRGRRTVVFFERTEQVREMAMLLMKEGILCSVCIQGKDELEDFEGHRTNVLLVCQKLREGWNDVSISLVIMASCNTRVIKNTQTLGRMLRVDPKNPDKKSDAYLLLADGTSDLNVIKNLKYPKELTEETTMEDITRVATGRWF